MGVRRVDPATREDVHVRGERHRRGSPTEQHLLSRHVPDGSGRRSPPVGPRRGHRASTGDGRLELRRANSARGLGRHGSRQTKPRQTYAVGRPSIATRSARSGTTLDARIGADGHDLVRTEARLEARRGAPGSRIVLDRPRSRPRRRAPGRGPSPRATVRSRVGYRPTKVTTVRNARSAASRYRPSPVNAASRSSTRAAIGIPGRDRVVLEVLRPGHEALVVVGGVEEPAGRIGEPRQDPIHQRARRREPALVERRLVQREQAVGEVARSPPARPARSPGRPSTIATSAPSGAEQPADDRLGRLHGRGPIALGRPPDRPAQQAAASAKAAIARPFQAASALSSRAGWGRSDRRARRRSREAAQARFEGAGHRATAA